MPQLKHLARFTTPVNLNSNDKKDTPINTYTPVLSSARKSILQALTQSSQPLSIIEIAEAASRLANRPYGEMQVRTEVKALIAGNLVSSRKETKEEQSVRADGGRAPNILASLYWAPAGVVPARTVAEAVPGLKLYSQTGVVARKVYKYSNKPASKSKRRFTEVELVDVTPVPTNSNAVVDYLIEKMVAERTAEIQAQLDAANAKLDKLQELFKSAL
jgi:hypothetical protein